MPFLYALCALHKIKYRFLSELEICCFLWYFTRFQTSKKSLPDIEQTLFLSVSYLPTTASKAAAASAPVA